MALGLIRVRLNGFGVDLGVISMTLGSPEWLYS